MERRVVRLSHVAKYHVAVMWLPGRGNEGRKEAKAVLRFLLKGDGKQWQCWHSRDSGCGGR